MHDFNWIQDIYQEDQFKPMDQVEHEPVYTLFMPDFLIMPDINYRQLLRFDPYLRSLLN